MNRISIYSPYAGGLLAACIFLISGPVRAQDAPADVKPNHWAYEAVSDLAKKGLIKGYPPDGRFLGGRTLTRYEMAAIIKRILDRMDDIVKNQPKPGVSQEDFDKLKSSVGEIQQLVNEFKTQLTVIGTDLNTVKDDLTTLKGKVSDLSAKVDGFDTRLNALSTKVDAATVLADQALNNIEEVKNATNAALAKKVDIGVGKLRISGLIQNWFGTSFGDTFGGNITALNPAGQHANFGTTPPGRTYGGGVGDTYRLRRGEIALIGSITPMVDYRAMFDVAKNGTGSASVLQDLWVGYQIAPRFRVEVGQQKTQMSEEGTRSSSQLLTVERSIMNGLPAQAGRVGDIRDTGAVARYQGALGNVALGIWDDNGLAQNSVAGDRFKFATFTGYFTGLRHITLGVWGGAKIGDFRPRNIRDRAGATLKVEYGRHSAEAEFAIARDRSLQNTLGTAADTRSLGGYALYAYALSPTWQFVGRYDEWDPSVHGGVVSGATISPTKHNLREYTFGVNYYMKSHNAKIMVNYIIEDPQSGGIGFWGYRRQLLLSNFQTAW